MEHRKLGKNGPQVSALGLGCMGMSFAYGPTDDEESLRVLRRYLELGGNFLDTAEIYGPYKNEELLGRFLREVPRDSVIVATKFGFRIGPGGHTGVDSSPENVRRACDGSLQRLGIETIDLYYQHRVDPKVPIEETVGAMAKLVSAGKVRMIGLSEASPETVRRAAKVHPIAALQSEYSLWSREVEVNGVLATCRELGITFIPYSPLGRGFLTGAIQKLEDLDPTRLAADESPLRREGAARKSQAGRGGQGIGQGKRRDACTTGAGLGARPGRRRSAHPRDKASSLSGGQHGRAPGKPDRERPEENCGAPRADSSRRRALHARNDGPGATGLRT